MFKYQNPALLIDPVTGSIGYVNPVTGREVTIQDPLNVNIGGGTAMGVSLARVVQPNALALSPWVGKPVANESIWLENQWTNVYGQNTRKRYIANRATGFVRLVYANGGMIGDASPTGPLTVRAAIEPSNGAARQRVTFGGKVDGEIAPGGILISDPVTANINSGAQFWVWTYSSGPNQFFYDVNLTNPAWGEGCDAAFNTASQDVTVSGAVTANSASFYAPIAVIGDAAMTLPFVGHFGDSIAAGTGDTAALDVGTGFLRRAMNNATPFVNLCVPGDNYTNSKALRYLLVQGCTDVIDEMGINDIVSSNGFANMQTRMLTAWKALGAFGARVWRTTITPSTSSTDSWATVANQTPNANDSTRTALNDWIRDGAPLVSTSNLTPAVTGTAGALRAGTTGHPLAGYFEVADTVESARNSGKWAVGSVYITDGLGRHPNSAGHAAMAAAINTSRFTA